MHEMTLQVRKRSVAKKEGGKRNFGVKVSAYEEQRDKSLPTEGTILKKKQGRAKERNLRKKRGVPQIDSVKTGNQRWQKK